MVHANYFEGILQLRNQDQTIIDFIDQQLKKNNKTICKIIRLKNGIDIYFPDKKYMSSIATIIIKQFGGELKKSASLHTRNHLTSKNVYRQNIVIHFPDYKTNEVIQVDKKFYQVLNFGKKITILDLHKEKKQMINYPEKYRIIPKQKTRIISLNPLQVLHPENYQAIDCKNPLKKKLTLNKEVNIIVDDLGNAIII